MTETADDSRTNPLDIERAAAVEPPTLPGDPAHHAMFAAAVAQRWNAEAVGALQSQQIDAALRGFSRAVVDVIMVPGTSDGVRNGLLDLMVKHDIGLARVAHTVRIGDGHRFRVDTLEVTFHGAAVSQHPLAIDHDREMHDDGVGWATDVSPLVTEVVASPMQLPGARAAERRFHLFRGDPQRPLGPDPMPITPMAVESSGAFLDAMTAISADLNAVLTADSDPTVSGRIPAFIHPSCARLTLPSSGETASGAVPDVIVGSLVSSVAVQSEVQESAGSLVAGRDQGLLTATQSLCAQLLAIVEPVSAPAVPTPENPNPVGLNIDDPGIAAFLAVRLPDVGFQQTRCYVRLEPKSSKVGVYDLIVPTLRGEMLLNPADSWAGNPKQWLGFRPATGWSDIPVKMNRTLPLASTKHLDWSQYDVDRRGRFRWATDDPQWQTSRMPSASLSRDFLALSDRVDELIHQRRGLRHGFNV